MTLHGFLAQLLARFEDAFEREGKVGGGTARADDRARGEFISTLIIDHGALGETDGRTGRGKPRG